MKTNIQFPDTNGINSRRIENFYNTFAAFCTKHFGAQPCDLALDWHNVGANLRVSNFIAHIDLNIWIVSQGAEGLPDNLVRVETWSYYPLRSKIHSAEALKDFIKQQIDKGIDEENLLALKDLLLTQVATAKSMEKEFQDKLIKFLTLTSLTHNFTHLAFDGIEPTTSANATDTCSTSDAPEVQRISAPSYGGVVYQLS